MNIVARRFRSRMVNVNASIVPTNVGMRPIGDESMNKHDRTEEIKKLWESTPRFAIEAGLSANPDLLMSKALECLTWVTDFQLEYKDEFAPFDGLGAIIDDDAGYKDIDTRHRRSV